MADRSGDGGGVCVCVRWWLECVWVWVGSCVVVRGCGGCGWGVRVGVRGWGGMVSNPGAPPGMVHRLAPPVRNA